MNNAQYIAALKRSLSGLDKASQTDIIRELESHASESQTLLSQRFDAPEEMAKRYLEGEVTSDRGNKASGISKRLLSGLALLVVALLILALLAYWWMSRNLLSSKAQLTSVDQITNADQINKADKINNVDQINNADETTLQLSDDNRNWSDINGTNVLAIKTNQSAVTFFWHDSDNIRWSCDGSSPKQEGEHTLLISQARCIAYLPVSINSIDANQTQLVMIRPQASLELNLHHSNLRIAENGERYRYETDLETSNINGLQSQQNASHTIRINAVQASVSAYE